MEAILELTKLATESNATHAAKKALTGVEVSHQTVSNILKSFNITENGSARIRERTERLNDEGHCNLQEKQAKDKRKKNIIANQ